MNDIFNDNVSLKTETPAISKHVLPAVPTSDVDLFGCTKIIKETFTESFLVPPFSVLDTKQPYWQKRKKVWKNLILDDGSKRAGKLSKRTDNWNEESETFEIVSKFDVSILDPVLTEVLLKWFAFENCKTFDPFAGDTVFGYVSSFLGNEFTGIELREEQVDFNTEKTKGLNAKYICDDALNILNHIEENSKDFLFSCPPYFDLEKYSQLPNDASNQNNFQQVCQLYKAYK